jgi:hypothetical protein
MAQYDIVFAVNEAASGELFSEQKLRLAKGQLLAGSDGFPTIFGPVPDDYMIIGDTATLSGLNLIHKDVLSSGQSLVFSGDVSQTGSHPNYSLTINSAAVSNAKLASNAVTTIKISNANVTYAKIQNVTANRLLGRVGTNGSVQEISLGSGLSFNGSSIEAVASAIVEIVTVSNANHTLVLSDAGKYIRMVDNAASRIVYVPANTSVAFALGTVITIEQGGTQRVDISPSSGVIVNAYNNGEYIPGQYAAVQLVKTATNTWTMIGAMI